MIPNPKELLELSGINTPLIGFYDVPENEPFEPFAKPKRCFFSVYENWLVGESVCVSLEDPNFTATCQGGGYWIGSCLPQWTVKEFNSEQEAREKFAIGLNQREGFKSSDDIMHQWLENIK